MKSFFSGIQGLFSAKFHGRYLGLILQEIGNRRPELIISFICKACNLAIRSCKKPRFEAEYPFQGKSGKRIADLAIFKNDDDEPFVLIEIKYFDKLLNATETKPTQPADYVTWKNKSEGDTRHVIILSRELIIESEIVSHRWGELASHLREHAKESELADMLVTYLEEEGVVMQEINTKFLLGFFKRLLCGSKGVGDLTNNLQGPIEFANFLKNLRLLSVPLDRHFKHAWSKAGAKVVGDDYAKTSHRAYSGPRFSDNELRW